MPSTLDAIVSRRPEFLIVGAGAGGAALAWELARRGRRVLVLERGGARPGFGRFIDAYRMYDAHPLTLRPRMSREGVILWRAFGAGGTTQVSCGNGVRCLESELRAAGIEIAADLDAVERDLEVSPIAESLLSDASLRLRGAATEAGYPMSPMPKFFGRPGCRKCGRCVFGCDPGTKWTSRRHLERAVEAGAEIVFDARVLRVLTDGGRAVGVAARINGSAVELRADHVILAAGTLATTPLLREAGISEAGDGFFADLFVNVYGRIDGWDQRGEPVMTLAHTASHDSRGFILSPFIHTNPFVRFMESGWRGAAARSRGLAGIMVKIRDDASGSVEADGTIRKRPTEGDRGRLADGVEAARRDRRGMWISRVQGAHPGGTAAAGRVVDSDLSTRLPGLWVCDGSVLPTAPGLPPILTIVALGRRLGRHLAG